MLLNHLQQEVYKKYQLILLMNLSIISLLLMIIDPTILNINTQLILLLTTVTIIGIPHGYFDFLIAKNCLISITIGLQNLSLHIHHYRWFTFWLGLYLLL